MYTLINDLWKSQLQHPFENQIHIPTTIIINPGFKIGWYFTKNNQILKKKEQHSKIPNILKFFSEANSLLIKPPQHISVDNCASISLEMELLTGNNLQQTLIHYQTYPYLIQNPIIIQEIVNECSFVSCNWNKNYTFIQQCDKQTFSCDQKIKITQHFRQQIDKLTQEVVERLQYLNNHRGIIQELRVIYILKDKPIFLWCTELKFDRSQLMSNLGKEGNLWQRQNSFELQFTVHKGPTNLIKFRLPLKQINLLSTQLKENQENKQGQSHEDERIQQKCLEKSRKSIPLTNRSSTNRSHSNIRLSANPGSSTQRTEHSIIDDQECQLVQKKKKFTSQQRTIIGLQAKYIPNLNILS